jgi:hypothetical protein
MHGAQPQLLRTEYETIAVTCEVDPTPASLTVWRGNTPPEKLYQQFWYESPT